MVAVGRAGGLDGHVDAAMDAAEALGAAIVTALTVGARQRDSVSGYTGSRRIERRHAPGQETTVPAGTVSDFSERMPELRASDLPEA
jgi:hypothetical protein